MPFWSFCFRIYSKRIRERKKLSKSMEFRRKMMDANDCYVDYFWVEQYFLIKYMVHRVRYSHFSHTKTSYHFVWVFLATHFHWISSHDIWSWYKENILPQNSCTKCLRDGFFRMNVLTKYTTTGFCCCTNTLIWIWFVHNFDHTLMCAVLYLAQTSL